MNVTDSDDVLRLSTVIDRQRRELDRLRAAAAGEAVVSMARGALMERLGLSSAEAASQLAELSAATGVPLAEMAAAVLSPLGSASAARASGDAGDVADARARVSGDAGDVTDARACASGDSGDVADARRASAATTGPRWLLTEAAAELAADGAELVGTLASQALAPLGASTMVLWLLEADGALTLLGEAGLPLGEASRWWHIPPQLDCPAQRIARGAADIWWHAGPPAGDSAPVIGPAGGARAVLALRERNAELLGVMEVGWREPLPPFGSEIRAHLSALAAGSARVIAARLAHGDLAAAHPKAAVYELLDGLAEAVLAVRPIRDDGGRVTDFGIEHASPGFRDPAGRTGPELTGLTLLEAYPASVAGHGLFTMATQILSDGAAQYVPGPAGESLADLRAARFFDGAIFTGRRDAPSDRLAALLDHAQRLGRLGGWEEDLVTGAVRWTDSAFELFGLVPRPGAEIPLADLHSYVMAADKPAVQRFRQDLPERREAATATFRVVHPDSRGVRQIRVFAEPVTDATGAVVALRGAFQDVSAHYQTQVALAATRVQLADSEQRVAEEHRLALRLQRAIMPPNEQPVRAAGIDVAVRYRPAGEGHLVGGDWYDALLLPDNDVLLVVGDVAGHGIDAVTGMVAARNSLRGLAITGAGPAELLRMLNGVMCHFTSGVVGTVVCGRYSPATRVLRWARAGHLPPVLLRRGKGEHPRTARQLPLPGGMLLGMDPDAAYEEASEPLERGDTLLLFTDGLIEQRGESIDDVLGEFVTILSSGALDGRGTRRLTAAAQADRVLARVVSDTADDACLVVVRIA